MAYLKQNDMKTSGKQSRKKSTATIPVEKKQDVHCSAGSGLVADSLDFLTEAVRDYVVQARNGENMLKLFTGPEGSGYYPLLIALDPCGETTKDMLAVGERIATAFERIADAIAVKTQGS